MRANWTIEGDRNVPDHQQRFESTEWKAAGKRNGRAGTAFAPISKQIQKFPGQTSSWYTNWTTYDMLTTAYGHGLNNRVNVEFHRNKRKRNLKEHEEPYPEEQPTSLDCASTQYLQKQSNLKINVDKMFCQSLVLTLSSLSAKWQESQNCDPKSFIWHVI